MPIYHVCFSLDALIHRGEAALMAGYVKLPGAADWATEAEIIAHATILKAQGFEVLPSCADHDKKGYCPGHETGA